MSLDTRIDLTAGMKADCARLALLAQHSAAVRAYLAPVPVALLQRRRLLLERREPTRPDALAARLALALLWRRGGGRLEGQVGNQPVRDVLFGVVARHRVLLCGVEVVVLVQSRLASDGKRR
jgi:hypothetical protein